MRSSAWTIGALALCLLAACAAPPLPPASPSPGPGVVPTVVAVETDDGLTPASQTMMTATAGALRPTATRFVPPLAAPLPTPTVPRATAMPANSPVEQVWQVDGQPAHAFARPIRLALDGLGGVYIVDTENHRVQKYD